MEMILTENQQKNKEISNKFLDEQEIQLNERYRTLSELYVPKSKHATHVLIGKMMDDALAKLKRVKILRELVKETLG